MRGRGGVQTELTRLVALTIQKMTNARMMKFNRIVRKLPQASTTQSVRASASGVPGGTLPDSTMYLLEKSTAPPKIALIAA